MYSFFGFLQEQVLGMKWLNDIVATLLSAIGVDLATALGKSIHFFVYDTIKILVLLSVLIFIISYIQSYFPAERTKKILAKHNGITANILSALIGTVTPFCSCSSIPLFIGFTNAGIPIGATFSFLISSPLVDLGSLVLLTSIFGGKVAVAYVVVGLVLAVLGGTIIEKLGMEKHIKKFAPEQPCCACSCKATPTITKKDRVQTAYSQVIATFKSVFWYVIVGVGIGALIHNWVPTQFIEAVLGQDNPFSVIIATVLGVPMYADIFGTIPVAEALFAKGVGIGTVLSFMMAVTALSLPSMIMLKKVINVKLLAVFISIITIGIIFIGYLFNMFQFLLV